MKIIHPILPFEIDTSVNEEALNDIVNYINLNLKRFPLNLITWKGFARFDVPENYRDVDLHKAIELFNKTEKWTAYVSSNQGRTEFNFNIKK